MSEKCLVSKFQLKVRSFVNLPFLFFDIPIVFLGFWKFYWPYLAQTWYARLCVHMMQILQQIYIYIYIYIYIILHFLAISIFYSGKEIIGQLHCSGSPLSVNDKNHILQLLRNVIIYCKNGAHYLHVHVY